MPYILLCLFTQAGCDLYQEGYDLNTEVSECEAATGTDCEAATGANLLGIHISNAQPYTILNANVRRFDITGQCNEGDFPENIIEWSVYHISTNTPVLTGQKIYQGCKRGKFSFQVDIAGVHGSDADCALASPPASCTYYNELHRLTIELVGKDINGTEYRNVLAAKRTLDFLAINP